MHRVLTHSRMDWLFFWCYRTNVIWTLISSLTCWTYRNLRQGNWSVNCYTVVLTRYTCKGKYAGDIAHKASRTKAHRSTLYPSHPHYIHVLKCCWSWSLDWLSPSCEYISVSECGTHLTLQYQNPVFVYRVLMTFEYLCELWKHHGLIILSFTTLSVIVYWCTSVWTYFLF